MRSNGEAVAERFAGLPAGASVGAVVDGFLAFVRPVVLESAQGSGCAVAAVATEVDAGSPLQAASGTAFTSWQSALAGRLTVAGATPERAAELAALLVITLEGAHVLCRAEGSIAPFDAAVAALRAALG